MTSELKPDLSSFGYADGGYMSKCSHCKETFLGAKRAWSCEPCAIKKSIEPKITRAVPDVPELVTVAKQYRWGGDPKWRTFPPIFKDDTLEVRELVLHSQAAEIIAAKDKEIERLKDDSRITFDKYLDAHNENVTLKAELAQYEAQEPIGYLIGDGHFTMSEKQAEIAKSCTTFTVIPLYASPAPAAELRAENERYKQALEFYANISPISYDFGHTAKTALNPSEPRT